MKQAEIEVITTFRKLNNIAAAELPASYFDEYNRNVKLINDYEKSLVEPEERKLSVDEVIEFMGFVNSKKWDAMRDFLNSPTTEQRDLITDFINSKK